MSASGVLTSTELVAASSQVLEQNGYQSVKVDSPGWDTGSTRLFESDYNVVGVGVFQTVADLLRSWSDLQGALVQVISQQVGAVESKAWDGYLVLLTPGMAPSGDAEVDSIRCDTARLRKLVGTGEDLASAGDVERLLRPLVPLREFQDLRRNGTALDLLPGLLAEEGISLATTETLVKAFVDQKPLMDALHHRRNTK